MELPILGQEPQASELILGIDLGTTHSLVAVYQHGEPRVLHDGEGDALIPSVVSFPQGGAPVVGKAAVERMRLDPLHTIYSAKRLIGRSVEDLEREISTLPYKVVHSEKRDMAMIDLGERLITPQEVSAHILQACRDRAAAELKLDAKSLTKVVITVPAYFDDAQRQATRRSASLAGLEVMRIVSEPTAAALAYGLNKQENCKAVVFDLGGGTFDVSVLELHDDIFRVIATAGDTHLGGDDFDRAIMMHCAAEIREQSGVEVLADPRARAALRMISEDVKKQLSSSEEAEFVYHDADAGIAYRRTVDWRTFQNWIIPHVQRTLDHCVSALHDAKQTPDSIDEIILVGGSTRVPFVKAAVAQLFNRPANDSINPDEVVALGAAIQAGILGGEVKNALLLDVTPLSLGIGTAEGTVSKIINRNSAIPVQAKEGFTTYVDGQTAVKFTIVQGERELVKDNRTLGEFELRGIPPMAAGLPQIGVRFQLDANGMLRVFAKEEKSGVESSISIEPKHGLTDNEVENMLADAWQNAEQDLETRRIIDLHAQRKNVLRAVHKHQEFAKENLSPKLWDELHEATVAAENIEGSTEAKQIKNCIDDLEGASIALAESLMNDVANNAVKNQKVSDLSS
ncbi:MAG: Fe-S protein assembly chaperone HscA [Planctomycetes bacterium]|nr:Fe-S protein assembly chaperone HscA [Planctomycetota bacterium]